MSKKVQKSKKSAYVDTVAKDFRMSVVIVSLGANLVIFVAWVTALVA